MRFFSRFLCFIVIASLSIALPYTSVRITHAQAAEGVPSTTVTKDTQKPAKKTTTTHKKKNRKKTLSSQTAQPASTDNKKTAQSKKRIRTYAKNPVANTARERYAALVIDAQTGAILHEENGAVQRYPASLTKMMTLYITFKALEAGRLKMDQRLLVSARAAAQPPTKLGVYKGQGLRVRDAILGLVTESANDAAMVLAEALGGSEQAFANAMTQQARALGMTQTLFRNASGLPNEGQITSARDMARLGWALMTHYPQYYDLFSTTSFPYGGRDRRNHNHLMKRYYGMDGIKTGYIRASGFNLVASAVRDNIRLIGVVFGGTSAPSRDNKMAALLDDGFVRAAQYRRNARGRSDQDYLTLPTSR